MHKLGLALLSAFLGFAPAQAQQPVVVPATMASIPITISTATTTLLVTNTDTSKSIYVTAVDVIAAGTGNIQFISGTGATCAVTSANVTGNYNLIAQVGFTKAAGNGVVWVIPAGKSLCAVTSSAVGMPGSLSYAIF